MAATPVPVAELAEASARLTAHLPVPKPPPEGEPWQPQSLAKGAAGIALHRIELAHAGLADWRHAHAWISAATGAGVSAADATGLFLGAPAIAFMLHAAAAGTGRYAAALADVDGAVAALAERRVSTARARIAAGRLAGFSEYDVFYGLSGIGTVLLHRAPAGGAMEQVLDYLVALTQPLSHDGRVLPGWWVGHDPHRRISTPYRDGHGNFGAAHGITGPLALLAQAFRRGVIVDGHRAAIETICAFLDAWRQDGLAGPWWPEWITVAELEAGRSKQAGPARPSWCYGTPGIARAGQLAGIATGDRARQALYETALMACLDDPAQRARVTDAGICHGWAGLFQTLWRAAHDAADSRLHARIPEVAEDFALSANAGTTGGPGFLDGQAGTALALLTAATGAAPISGWDACLLID